VVVARALYPSELLKLAAESVAGIVLANGGVTSHVAIIARSLKIPMVVVQCPELMHLPPDTGCWWTVRWAMSTWIPSADIVARFRCPQPGPAAGGGTARTPRCGRAAPTPTDGTG
jgi:phosphotransferase system enzyme I (PtsP)